MQYDERSRKIVLDDGEDTDYINIEGLDFQLDYLETESSDNSNGFVFNLYDPNEKTVSQVIKFSRIYQPCTNHYLNRRLERFQREVTALKTALNEKMNNRVVRIISEGTYIINEKIFLFYTMEKGDCNLTQFLNDEYDLSDQQKFLLSYEIIKCIEALHEIGIYHRDIKPTNFLMFNRHVKVCDLGLVSLRGEDTNAIDGLKEKIGPRGFLTPEAINKMMGFNKNNSLTIDDKSDVYQLAKVLGVVLQGEIFSGVLASEDLEQTDPTGNLYKVLEKALQYSQGRRYNIQELKTDFLNRLNKTYAFA